DRMARGVRALDRGEVDLAKVVARVVGTMDIPPGRQINVEADSVVTSVDTAKVERIVENLVANALKYSPEAAPVRIVVATVAGEPTLVVEDAGPGVAPDEREAIFEPFRRGRSAAGVDGVGVGLSLV